MKSLYLKNFSEEAGVIRISKNRLEEVIRNFSGKRIMVIGDLMLDEYLVGEVIRISPEAPVPVVEISEQSIRFGGAANVALNLLRLGCRPPLVGTVGNDREAGIFRDLMDRHDMETAGLVVTADRPTTMKTRIIGHTQHIARVDRESKVYISGETETRLLQLIISQLPEVDAIIMEDYNKGVLSERIISGVTSAAVQHDILVTVDPKFINFMKYQNVTVFKPNIKETEQALALHIDQTEQVVTAGRQLMKELNAETVLITRGAQGMSLFEKSGEVTHVETRARKIADVSGAGDTVISVMTAAITGGASYKEAATLANHAAGIVCAEVGIVPIEIEPLFQACDEHGLE